MNKQIAIIFILLIQLDCYSQTSSFIGGNINGWASRYFGDVYYYNRKPSNFGYTVSLGFGQLGKRIYNNKTKDIFGRTFSNEERGKHFYTTSNIGGNGKISFSYQFNFNKFIKLEVGILAIIAVYRQKSSYDNYDTIVNDIHYQDIVKEQFMRINFAFGFEINTSLRISKKAQVVIGISNPFYLLNPNKFGISKAFDPPLLGAEPLLTIGFRYQLSGILNK